jgi:hypothetical protein
VENVAVQAEPAEFNESLVLGMERRLVSRLLTYWRDLCDDRTFPLVGDVRPDDIPDLWPRCFILSLADEAADAAFRWTGDALSALGGDGLNGRPVSEAQANSLLGMATAYFGEVLAKGAPVSRGGAFQGVDGTTVKFRSILLPMGDGADRIVEILGAISWLEEPQSSGQPV